MTPTQYWIGWAVMAVVVALVLSWACWYLGMKLDAILEALRGR